MVKKTKINVQNRQEHYEELADDWFREPILILVIGLVVGSIFDIILGINGRIFAVIFPVAGFIIFLGKKSPFFRETLDEKLIKKLNKSLSNKKIRDPLNYVYIDEPRVKELFTFITNSYGTIVGRSDSNELNVGLSSGVASISGAKSKSYDFNFDSKYYFEAIENKLREKYEKIKLSELKNQFQTGWINGIINSIQSNPPGGIQLKDFEQYKVKLSIQPEFLKSEYRNLEPISAFSTSKILNMPVELFGKFSLQNLEGQEKHVLITPFVILQRVG